MKFSKTNFEGLYTIDVEPFIDERGQFYRTFCKKEFLAIGHHKEFVQVNHSVNLFKGTFRGLHYQKPPFKEIKVVRCISGSVLDIVVDIRKNSKTFLKSYQLELSAENHRMLYIPEGFAHGFLSIEDNTQLIYFHSSFYNPEYERGLRYNDPILQIKIPFEPSFVSEKDMEYPLLKDTFTGI